MKNPSEVLSSSPPIPVLVLFGPTASGKTNVLLRLFGDGGLFSQKAEVISADSMQVYRGMDIGTAKPLAEEKAKLTHHLIDIRNPDEQFNAGDFVRLAGEAILDIARRGAFPVVCGGTGFYLKNLIMGLPSAPPSDEAIRAALKQELREKGAAALMEELARFDPASAEKIHLNDEYRLLRALEVLRLSGRPLSSFGASGADVERGSDEESFRSRCRFLVIGLSRPREELYRRINARCASMFERGLPDEVRKLYEAGYSPRDPGLRAIGYREFFIEDETSGAYRLSSDIAGVEALVAQNSRRYAKRQVTFFNSMASPDSDSAHCSLILKEPHTSDFSPQAQRHKERNKDSELLRALVPSCDKIQTKVYAQWLEAGRDDEETALRLRDKLEGSSSL